MSKIDDLYEAARTSVLAWKSGQWSDEYIDGEEGGKVRLLVGWKRAGGKDIGEWYTSMAAQHDLHELADPLTLMALVDVYRRARELYPLGVGVRGSVELASAIEKVEATDKSAAQV